MIMPVSKKRLLLTLCPLYFLFYLGDAFLCGYFSLYFLERNIPAQQQAILLALIPFSMFVGCLLFSSLAKNGTRALWIFRICLFVEVGLIVGYAFCDSFLALVIMTPIIGLVNSAPFSLIEGYVVPRVEKKGANYSVVRIFGAGGYAVALLAGAILLRYVRIHDCFYLSSAFYLAALALTFLLREDPVEPETLEERPKEEASSKKRFSFSRGAMIFCLSQALIYGAFNGSLYLMPVHLNNVGFLDADYSLMRGVGVVIEMAFFCLAPFVTKFTKSKRTTVIISGAFFIVSTFVGVCLIEPWSLASVFFVCNSIAKALLFSHQASLLRDIVGEDDLSRVLTISSGGINLTTALLNLFSASLFEAWGYQGYFGLITGMEFVGVLLLFALPRKQNEKPKEEMADLQSL